MTRPAEEIMAEVLEEEREAQGRRVQLAHGRTLTVSDQPSLVEIASEEGVVELTVRITPDGPVLSFSATRLELQASADLSIKARDVAIAATGTMRLESGDFEQRVAGGHTVAVRDDAALRAQAIDIEAEMGELGLKASDDVALNGLRVLMNVPTEEELARYRKESSSIRELMSRPFFADETSPRLPKTPARDREDW